MEAGASGFVVKDTPARQLAEAVRRVHAGLRVLDPTLAEESLVSGTSPLTARETEVLQAARGGGTVADLAAVLPLSRNADLSPKAKDLAAVLRRNWNVDFDDAGAIGRRYRRQDEVGTPFCLTVDFDTLDDQAVTIRERDSMSQERIGLDAVEAYLAAHLPGC